MFKDARAAVSPGFVRTTELADKIIVWFVFLLPEPTVG